MPDLAGISAAGPAPFVATAAGGLTGRSGARPTTSGVPPVGGVGAGAMGVRAGTMSRGMASGRSGPHRSTAPTLTGAADDEAARAARDKDATRQAEKEAKRAALAEKRAQRAVRKAEREAEEHEREAGREPVDLAEPVAETAGEDEAPRR
jgi:hypothetical protein